MLAQYIPAQTTTAGDWYLIVFTIGGGVSIAGIWLTVLLTKRTGEVAAGRGDFGWHVAAELVTGALMFAAGVAQIVDARRADLLTGIALGALVYALTESAGHYLVTGNKLLAYAVFAGWPFALAAAGVLFAR